MSVNQISVFIENRPGSLADLANDLRENGIDIRALSLADVRDYGILRIIVDDIYAASAVLRNAEYVFRITPVLAVTLQDQAGSLADALNLLGRSNINIEYLYAFTGTQRGKAYVIFRVNEDDMEKATQILAAGGFPPVGQDELQLDKQG